MKQTGDIRGLCEPQLSNLILAGSWLAEKSRNTTWHISVQLGNSLLSEQNLGTIKGKFWVLIAHCKGKIGLNEQYVGASDEKKQRHLNTQ